jgi:hypothetical protein
MKHSRALIAFALVFAGAAVVLRARQEQAVSRIGAPAPPLGVHALDCAVPFRLGQAYAHAWRAEQPAVHGGWIAVLDVERAALQPTELAQPVLCLGSEVVQRVNRGAASGKLVVIVPSPLGADGLPTLDLALEPAWFMPPALPETLDAVEIALARASAEASGVPGFPPAQVQAALACGGAPLDLADQDALLRAAAGFVLTWSPDEAELANGFLAPLVE